MKTAVQSALKDAVSRVLTPKKSTDVLREVSISASTAPHTVPVWPKILSPFYIDIRVKVLYIPGQSVTGQHLTNWELRILVRLLHEMYYNKIFYDTTENRVAHSASRKNFRLASHTVQYAALVRYHIKYGHINAGIDYR